jgi:hypothetical protein
MQTGIMVFFGYDNNNISTTEVMHHQVQCSLVDRKGYITSISWYHANICLEKWKKTIKISGKLNWVPTQTPNR